MVDWIITALQAMWRWVLDAGAALWDSIFNGFVTLPDMSGTSLAGFSDSLTIINQWLPIDVGVVLIAAYWAAVAAFIIAKYIIKAIPTVG